MNGSVFAVDTSNYTTSCAVLENGVLRQSRALLPVDSGEKGLRQSDAVFSHIRQFANVVSDAGTLNNLSAVGCSDRPRDTADSYMPCFLVGKAFAQSLASLFGVNIHMFSHQAGHIAAALYGANQLDMLEESFFSFHISGGTLEGVKVTPDKNRIISVEIVARTADISAGQVIDRVGVMLGLGFPCGPALEKLASCSTKHFNVKPCIKERNICLSGLENLCKKMYNDGGSPEDVAKFCLEYLAEGLATLYGAVTSGFFGSKTVFCGGVMSNKLIRNRLENKNTVFAPPEFCTDNAAGIAVLTALQEGMNWA